MKKDLMIDSHRRCFYIFHIQTFGSSIDDASKGRISEKKFTEKRRNTINKKITYTTTIEQQFLLVSVLKSSQPQP